MKPRLAKVWQRTDTDHHDVYCTIDVRQRRDSGSRHDIDKRAAESGQRVNWEAYTLHEYTRRWPLLDAPSDLVKIADTLVAKLDDLHDDMDVDLTEHRYLADPYTGRIRDIAETAVQLRDKLKENAA